MSVSQHPVALDLQQRVGDPARLLATVMALPLLDGLFVALLLAGTLDSPLGMLETGLLVFGGSATVAVILAEMDEGPRSLLRSIALIGAVLIPLAALQAAVAPVIESVIDLAVFQRFAGVVILAIAAQTASAKLGEYLPRPGIIIALGLLGSLRPEALVLELLIDVELMARAAVTAGIGVTFAAVVALAAPTLRGAVDIDRFRFGSSVALGVFALPILGVLNTDAPIALAVLLVSALLAYRPDLSGADAAADDSLLHKLPAVGDDEAVDRQATDGGPESAADAEQSPSTGNGTGDYEYGDDVDRAPWL
ncbi:hypothetical protein EGH24_11315 [Halonotius terrestris]|uniref:Uncharacterized protein n=1 Tax=Halonotius terrestris TaxID=2487750 RepID=A0A8J8PAP4_9EURY|nr:DUF5794 domain-containing protein [Halonotius terrestris]TQQ79217.1 hypothetical protein EGH24_11315 [Halonotius terrestris]